MNEVSEKILNTRLKSVNIDYIDNTFKDLGLQIRDNQSQEVMKIIKEFSKGKKYVVFAGSTGTGKSAIGAVVAEIISKLKMEKSATSIILSHTNVLSEQYEKMFAHNENFTMMQGKRNYPCHLLGSTAEKCLLKRNREKSLNNLCLNCEYRLAKARMNSKPHLITNYTFWLISQLYGEYLFDRDITIYDECHSINNVFSSNLEIIINEAVIKGIINKITSLPVDFEFVNNKKNELENLLKLIKRDLDIPSYLKKYLDILSMIYTKYDSEAQMQHDAGDIESYQKLETICHYLENKISTIACYFDYDYKKTEVVDWQKTEIRIKPIYINELSKIILTSDYNLFMSATINKSYIVETLSLDKKDVAFIKSESVFAPELKNVMFANIERVNYEVQNSPDFIRNMSTFIENTFKSEENNNGIIITPSFVMAETIYNNLRSDRRKKALLHRSGVGLKDIIDIFKTNDDFQYLISPSIWEGVSLDNEESSFQIVIKAPYPSLADDRISFIASRHPGLYRVETMFKMIQGFGRSTRHKEDYSRIYCVDLNLWSLFKLKKNIWYDEFYVRVVGNDINIEELDKDDYPQNKVKKILDSSFINVEDLY